MAKNSAAAIKKSRTTASANKKSTAKYLHVVRHAEGWVIRSEGSTRASSLHSTQREAVEVARALAERNAITLVIHGRDGLVKAWNSYSRDPKPPRKPRKVLYPLTPPVTASRDAIKKAVREAIREVTSKDKSSNGVVRANGRQRAKAGSKRDPQRDQVKA